MKTTYFICILKKLNLSLQSFEKKQLTTDNFKKHSNSVGRYLSPRYGQEILVSGYTVLTVVNEIKHWYAWSADGQKVRR